MRNEMTLLEMKKLINKSGFTARNKVAAAKFMTDFNGYEKARPNRIGEYDTTSALIVPVNDYVELVLFWNAEFKRWYIPGGAQPQHTPSDALKAYNRRQARKIEDSMTDYLGRNKKVMKHYHEKRNRIKKEMNELEAQIRELKNEYYSLPW